MCMSVEVFRISWIVVAEVLFLCTRSIEGNTVVLNLAGAWERQKGKQNNAFCVRGEGRQA